MINRVLMIILSSQVMTITFLLFLFLYILRGYFIFKRNDEVFTDIKANGFRIKHALIFLIFSPSLAINCILYVIIKMVMIIDKAFKYLITNILNIKLFSLKGESESNE